MTFKNANSDIFFVVLKDLKATPRIIFVCNLNMAFENSSGTNWFSIQRSAK